MIRRQVMDAPGYQKNLLPLWTRTKKALPVESVSQQTPKEKDGCQSRFARAYLGRKRWGDPDFLHAAPIRLASASFIKENRMKFINANKPHRKSGAAPTIASAALHCGYP
jgi:hypothetical protein